VPSIQVLKSAPQTPFNLKNEKHIKLEMPQNLLKL